MLGSNYLAGLREIIAGEKARKQAEAASLREKIYGMVMSKEAMMAKYLKQR
jgi:hypothetical protein